MLYDIFFNFTKLPCLKLGITMRPKHLFSVRDITKEEMEGIFSLASSIENNPNEYANRCEGKILANLFFEPSTRTRLSFESAIHRLGGKCQDLEGSKRHAGRRFARNPARRLPGDEKGIR